MDGRTDRWMDGIAVASTALALRSAVKMGFVDKFDSSMIVNTFKHLFKRTDSEIC